MADRSYTFLKGFFKADVDLALLVLNPEDWNKRQPTIPYGTLFADPGRYISQQVLQSLS